MSELQESSVEGDYKNTGGAMVKIKAISCSLLGVFLFLVPVQYEGNWTIPLGVLSSIIQEWLGDSIGFVTATFFVIGGIVAIAYNLVPYNLSRKLPMRERFTASHWVWTLLSLIGATVSVMTLFSFGPEWIIGEKTGVTAYIEVAGAIFVIIGLGCLFLPFLTDYGLLELVGTLLQRPFQRLFGLPGRACIDTLASWVGSSSIAVLMTGYQYERGYYTARESAIIATNFSVVSVPFVLLTAQVAGIPEYFFHLIGSMLVVCFICALISPKFPPLANINDDYHHTSGCQLDESVDEDKSRWKQALTRGMDKAQQAPSALQSLRRGFVSLIDIFVMMMPAAMTIEFLTLVAFYHTPIFQTLSYPFVYVLQWMQIPEAAAASSGVIIGLLDQFVPTIIAGDLSSTTTKFLLAGLSLTQLIFFAETALLIMRSPIPLSVMQLIQIFALRTVIALPILALIAHWVT